MKIFDLYIVKSFLRNYVLSFLVLVGLYVALDMVFRFDELSRGASSSQQQQALSTFGELVRLVTRIGDFYFYRMFAIFVQLSGIIPIVAAAFTLVRLMRHNELTAMLAAGVPMLRIAAPVVVMGVLMSALLVIDQELIIPNIVSKLNRDHDEIALVRGSSFPVKALEDKDGSLLTAARYNPGDIDDSGRETPPTMQEIDVIQFTPDRQPVAHIQARRAVYDQANGGWKLEGVPAPIRQTGMRQGIVAAEPIQFWKTDLGPNEISLSRRSNFVELLSTAQISSLLEHPRNYGTVPLLRVRHWRFVQPLTNIILLLLAIPCILTREPGALKAAVTKTVLVTGACLATIFMSHQFAGQLPSPGAVTYWPALMLWMPIFIFGPLAVWMLDRLKS